MNSNVLVAPFVPYRQRVYLYLRSMLHDAAEAEDLTQETFLRAHAQQATLRDADAALGWLYRIATHAALDRLRQRARMEQRECKDDLQTVESAKSTSPSALRIVEQKEMSGCVQGYVNRLAHAYRAAILLHDVHGLTAQEIAATLSLSVSTVKIRLHRARRKLQAELLTGCNFLHNDLGTFICEPKPQAG